MGLSYEEAMRCGPHVAALHPDHKGQPVVRPPDQPSQRGIVICSPYRAYSFFLQGWQPSRLNSLMAAPLGGFKLKRVDKNAVASAVARFGIPPATTKRSVRLILLVEKGQRRPDPDAFQKSLNDALVHCGALKNDSPDWVTILPVEYFRGPFRGSLVVLEDLD